MSFDSIYFQYLFLFDIFSDEEAVKDFKFGCEGVTSLTLRSGRSFEPKYPRSQRKRASLLSIDEHLKHLQDCEKSVDRSVAKGEVRYAYLGDDGNQKYAFMTTANQLNYLKIIESTLLYTTYYNTISNQIGHFYIIEDISRYEELTALQKIVLKSNIERLPGTCTCTPQRGNGNKFEIKKVHETRPEFSYKFTSCNENQYTCATCSQAHFKVTVYDGKISYYDVFDTHVPNCILVSDSDSDEDDDKN